MNKRPTDKTTAPELALVAAVLDPALAKTKPRQAVRIASKLISAAQEYIDGPSLFARHTAEILADIDRELAAKAAKLPDPVPFKKAVLHITDQRRMKIALPKFEKVFPAKKQLKMWRKNGIPKAEVKRLQRRFEGKWPRIVAGQNRRKAKKRGAKLNPEAKPVIREVLREIE